MLQTLNPTRIGAFLELPVTVINIVKYLNIQQSILKAIKRRLIIKYIRQYA